MKVSGEAFFLTNGEPWPFWRYTRVVAEEMGMQIRDEEIWRVPVGVACFFVGVVEWVVWLLTFGGRPSVTRSMIKYTAEVRTFDISKARMRLGYKPRVEMREGVRRAVKWHMEDERDGKKDT